MDCKDLQYGDSSFDVLIDKGTLDAIVVSSDFLPKCSDDSESDVMQYMNEVSRVLRSGGYFIYITFSNLKMRRVYVEREELNFEVEIIKLPKREFLKEGLDIEKLAVHELHWLFICRKK